MTKITIKNGNSKKTSVIGEDQCVKKVKASDKVLAKFDKIDFKNRRGLRSSISRPPSTEKSIQGLDLFLCFSKRYYCFILDIFLKFLFIFY